MQLNEAGGTISALADFKIGGFSLEQILRLVILLVGCIVVVKILLVFVDKAVTKLNVERSLHTFIKSAVRILLWFVVVLIMADALGIPITSLVALFSVIGLAVSLSIQGTLSNLAGGVMILVSKPFKVGDYVEANGVGGTVADIALVYTKVQTVDNKIIFLPNKDLSSTQITNYTTQDRRRMDLSFSLSYEADMDLVKETLLALIHKHDKSLFTPEPLVRVGAFKESSVEYVLRVWCATDDYWDLHFDLLEQGKRALDAIGAEMTYNHLNVHMIEGGSWADTPKQPRGVTTK